MKLSISSFYSEPGYHFSISYKVNNFICEKLTNMVLIPYNLDKEKEKTFLGLDITTSSKTKSLEVRDPEYDIKNDFINWGLWLPYEEIALAHDQLPTYLKYFFDAVVVVFKKYGVGEQDVRKVQRIVEDEVIDNCEYFFEEEEIPPPDLSFLDE